MKKSVFVVLMGVLCLLIGCGDDDDSNSTGPEDPGVLIVSETSLSFPTQVNSRSFTITNDGEAAIDWEADPSADWMEASPATGTLNGGASKTVDVTVDRVGMSEGNYTGSIDVTTADEQSATVDVTMEIALPSLEISLPSLDFDKDTDEIVFEITNAGDGAADWTIEIVNPYGGGWIEVLPMSGSTSVETDEVTVTVDRTDLNAGVLEGLMLTLLTDYGDTEVPITVYVGEILWTDGLNTEAEFTDRYDAWDGQGFAGQDYWGINTRDAVEGTGSVFCAEIGDMAPDFYDNGMDAWMRLGLDEIVSIGGHEGVVIRFSMKYEIEANFDYLYVTIMGTDGNWYTRAPYTWTGTNQFEWNEYSVPIEGWPSAPSNSLRFGFIFTSDGSVVQRGVYIDQIEVWGK